MKTHRKAKILIFWLQIRHCFWVYLCAVEHRHNRHSVTPKNSFATILFTIYQVCFLKWLAMIYHFKLGVQKPSPWVDWQIFTQFEDRLPHYFWKSVLHDISSVSHTIKMQNISNTFSSRFGCLPGNCQVLVWLLHAKTKYELLHFCEFSNCSSKNL